MRSSESSSSPAQGTSGYRQGISKDKTRSACRRMVAPWGRRTSGPVRRILSQRPESPWAVIHLGRPLPGGSCGLPAGSGEQPSNACAGHRLAAGALLGLAPGGVYLATPVARGAGELLPHRFTLTCPRGPAVCFLWHCPAGRPGLPLTTTLLCGVRTFLGGTPKGTDATAWPTRPSHRHSTSRLDRRIDAPRETPHAGLNGPHTLPRMTDSTPLLLFVIGPPAVGKMTVGRAIAARTGLRVFHNHLSIEPVVRLFDFGTPPFRRLVEGSVRPYWKKSPPVTCRGSSSRTSGPLTRLRTQRPWPAMPNRS